MFEYLWNLPGKSSSHGVCLRIHSERSWIGRKTLSLNGRLLYNRGRFAGINHEFPHPDNSRELVDLRAVFDPASRGWCIRLACAGLSVPEASGTAPPPTQHRPKALSVITGLTALVMLMTFIMLPHIWRMLNTANSRSANRVFVLSVVDSHAPAGLHLRPEPLPCAIVNQPYETQVLAEGGSPPYRLRRYKGHLPPGLEFDASTGTIRGLPAERGEHLVWIRAEDSSGAAVERPYALSVRHPVAEDLRIQTEVLPTATVGEQYSASLQMVDDPLSEATPATRYEWILNKSKLPKGLKADLIAGTIAGIPEKDAARSYPLTVRVVDRTYSPAGHLAPWGAPFVVTAACLLGFWNMRRWCVWLYGVLILGQLAVGFLAPDLLPLSWLACLLQVLIFGVAFTAARRSTDVRCSCRTAL